MGQRKVFGTPDTIFLTGIEQILGDGSVSSILVSHFFDFHSVSGHLPPLLSSFGKTDGRTDGRTDGQTSIQTNGGWNEKTNEQTESL